MNVKEALDLMMSRLGGRTSPELRNNCLLELKNAQEKLEQEPSLPWFIISEATFTNMTANERRVKLPPDFLKESDDDRLVYINADGDEVELVKGDFDDLIVQYTAEAEGDPERYAIKGPYIQLFPKPSISRQLEYSGYYARQQAPADSVDSINAWFSNASDLIIGMAGHTVAALHLKDPDLVEVFTSMEADGKRRLFHSEVAREEANRERDMESDD